MANTNGHTKLPLLNAEGWSVDLINSLLVELTLGELKLLYRVFNAQERTTVVADNSEAAYASSLFGKGLLEKFGRVGQVYRWKVPEVFSPENRQLLEELQRV